MSIADESVKEFQGLYLKYFGQKLSGKDARFHLTQLVRQVQIIYQPVTVAQIDYFIKNHATGGLNDG